MEFLQGEALSEHKVKLNSLLKTIESHVSTLKEEEQPGLTDYSNESLRKVGEKNLFLLRKLIEEKVRKGSLANEELLRLLRFKTKALLGGENLSEAKKCALEAYDLARTSGLRNLIWATSLDLTIVSRLMGKILDAEKYLSIASEHTSTLDEEHETTVIKGELLLARGKLNESIENILTPLLNKVHNKRIKGILLQKLGNGCRSAAKWGLAKQYLRQSIEIAKELQNMEDEFDRHGDLGNVYRSEGRIRDALEHQWLHLKFTLNRGDLAGLTAACFNVGFSNYSIKPQANVDNAMVFTVLNNILATRCHLEPLRGISLNNLGKIFMSMELYEPAITVFHDCVEVAKKTGNFGGEGMAYGNLGMAHRALKNYDDALKYHKMYRENARNRGDVGGMSIMQTEITLVYLLMGDLQNALKEVTASISTNELIRAELGREDASKVANFEKNQAAAFNLLVLILKKQGKYKEALAISELSRARALTDRICNITSAAPDNCSKWLRMENILVDQLLDEEFISKIVSDYIETATKLKSTFLVYSLTTEYDEHGKQQKWLYTWVVVPKSAKNPDAEKIHFTSVKIGDSARRTGLNLDETYFSQLTRSFGEMNVNTFEGLKENEQTTAQAEISEEIPTIGSNFGIVPKASLIIELLEQVKFGENDEKTEEKFEEDDEMLSKLRNIRLDKKFQSSRRVQVQEPFKIDTWEQLRLLYEVCFLPIKGILDEHLDKEYEPRLIIMPQEFLFNIPFCALQSADGKYLIQEYIISYTPSLRALLLLQEIIRSNEDNERKVKVLSVGNPDMPFKHVMQMENAEKEAKIVQDIFGDDNCILLTKDKAKKNAVLSLIKEIDVLHVATHAFPKDLFQKDQEGDYIMRGCILLSKSDDKCSGLLHAYEIEKEKSHLRLVTLSCCETGLGKVTGDGVIGLYRSFLATGTSSVVVTMWKIRDDITPSIMKIFYQDYVISKDASSALRKAMLHACEVLQLPPDQWAAFSLVGACK